MYTIAESIALPIYFFFTKTTIEGEHFVPRDGSVILASNHISFLDPITLGYLGRRRRRQVRFLAKDSLFSRPFLRWFFTSCGQIPVARGTDRASDSLIHAREALENNQCVGIFPEGTMPEDLVQLPIKSGTLRLAAETSAPIVVLGLWGAHRIWRRQHKPHFRFRARCTVIVTPAYFLQKDVSIEDARDELAEKMKEATRQAKLRWEMTK